MTVVRCKHLSIIAAFAAAVAPTIVAAQPAPAPRFHLRSGDRVVFYGDSITEQRLYTTFVETFVVTRFPTMDVRFTHVGWGGDRVTGGGGGSLQTRLERDVIPRRPTVVTVMLGMNDGRYRAFDQTIFDRYTTGYEELVRTLRAAAPDARLTLIQPSPYDEIAHTPPADRAGYNGVLLRFGAHIRGVAQRERLGFADLNTDLVDVLKRAKAADAEAAAKMVPDLVHPGPAGHLIMAGSLLAAWGAPALVSSVEIDARTRRVVRAANTRVWGVPAKGTLSWTALDGALPFPVDGADPVVALAARTGRIVEKLSQQPLKVTGLAAGTYALWIDDQRVAPFTAAELARGINLAALDTPMHRQAAEVHAATVKRASIGHLRWRDLQMKLAPDEQDGAAAALDGLDAFEESLIRKQRALARPRPRRFELVAEAPAASLPAGFVPALGGAEARTVTLALDRMRDAEIALELQDDAGPLGLLLRHDGRARGYRVSLDTGEPGSFGRVERIGAPGARPSPAPEWRAKWKKGEWNQVRVRIDGDRGRITVWLNDAQIAEHTPDVFGVPSGVDEPRDGLAALALPPDGASRVRNVGIRRLR